MTEQATDPAMASGPPARGRRYTAGDVQIDLNHGRPFDVRYRADRDTVTLNLGRMRYDVGIESDRFRSYDAALPAVGFGPCGAELRSRRTEAGEGFVNIAAPPRFWDEIAEASEAPPRDRQGLVAVASPNAVGLVGLARTFFETDFLGGRMAAEALAALAIAEVYRLRAGAPEPAPAAKLSDAALSRVRDYIEAHLAEEIRLDDLAGAACQSRCHFSRSFKATTGRSPIAYLAERRVARAAGLLTETECSLAEIAYACGFSSHSHLSAAFRRSMGATPSAYRAERAKRAGLRKHGCDSAIR